MIGAILLSLALMSGGESGDFDHLNRATWYGGEGSCYGLRMTCSPYLSTEDGGRGGELVMFAAAGWGFWGMRPVYALVTSRDTGRSVLVLVRDYCGACHAGRAILDLSPVAFSLLWRDGAPDPLTLGRGVATVDVRYLGAR